MPQTSAYAEIWLDKKKVAGDAVVDYEPLYGDYYLVRRSALSLLALADMPRACSPESLRSLSLFRRRTMSTSSATILDTSPSSTRTSDCLDSTSPSEEEWERLSGHFP